MARLIADEDILAWLNSRRRMILAGEDTPITDTPFGKRDDLTGGGIIVEGEQGIKAIQFLDSEGSGSVLSTAPDEEKRGCAFRKMGITFVWAREGEERVFNYPHEWRLVHVDV